MFFFRKLEEVQITTPKSTNLLIKWIQTNIENYEDLKKSQIKVEVMEVDIIENCPPLKFEYSQNIEFRNRIFKQLKQWPIVLPKNMNNLRDISIKCIKVIFFF